MNLVPRKHRVCGEGRRIAIAVEQLDHAWRKRQMIEAPASDHRLFQFGEREDGFADRRSCTKAAPSAPNLATEIGAGSKPGSSFEASFDRTRPATGG
ncbi:hypothetical protein BKP54_20470 [Ensifer sp. 1H6]|nr:hypothetical protein BKP54_20470 [Ensifer sp. 1H6]